MLDPVAVRSYLGSLGQQQGGAAQGGGVQAMLANLRQRLYGQQAGQQGAGQGQQGANPAAGMPNGVPPRLQALAAQDPAAAQARFAQFQAGQLPGQQGQPTLQGPQMPTAMPRPVRPMGGRQGVAQNPQAQAGVGVPTGDMGGPGSDIGFQPSGPFLSEPLPYDAAVLNADQATLNGLTGFPGAGDGPGPQFQSGGGLMAPAQMPPAVRQRLAQGVAQGAAGPSASLSQTAGPAYGDDGVMAQMPGNRAKPTAPAGPPASPAVLGTQEFQGPNARRINAARQGIFNNVRQALRRPAATGGKAGG
jgi:hypothetical protein